MDRLNSLRIVMLQVNLIFLAKDHKPVNEGKVGVVYV
jgi:hypothetical protein